MALLSPRKTLYSKSPVEDPSNSSASVVVWGLYGVSQVTAVGTAGQSTGDSQIMQVQLH